MRWSDTSPPDRDRLIRQLLEIRSAYPIAVPPRPFLPIKERWLHDPVEAMYRALWQDMSAAILGRPVSRRETFDDSVSGADHEFLLSIGIDGV